ALISGDERMARQVIERLRDGGQETVEICERLVTPALRRIGDAWAEGHVSLVEEHRASAMCTRLLAGISVHPRGRPRGVAVVTTVPGEAHELPGMMASMALRADRWQVHHLGTQVPYDQLAALVRRERATLVVLSVTHTRVQRDALHCAERVRRELGVRALTGRPGATLTDLIHGAKQAAAA
ncbi:MAG: MerR family transcriptional regulator, light-induced transcriptional regulator, partial [Acidimicrobiaceae bacterium]|nr:MerR family transcriptional regulator, light-induced transcriptional regulator [Acidimicrobiaceae bacterium]